MNNKWKIAIVVLFLMFAWIRLSPAIAWTLEANSRVDRLIEKEWISDKEECSIVYNWSWWSLRFTSVYLDC